MVVTFFRDTVTRTACENLKSVQQHEGKRNKKQNIPPLKTTVAYPKICTLKDVSLNRTSAKSMMFACTKRQSIIFFFETLSIIQ